MKYFLIVLTLFFIACNPNPRYEEAKKNKEINELKTMFEPNMSDRKLLKTLED